MNVLVTGGNGLLGSALCLEFIKKHTVFCCYHNSGIRIENENFKSLKMDIVKDSLNKMEKAQPDIIIHAAALTDLELCEKNPELAYDVNVTGTKNMLKVAKKCRAKLVYVCTDYIFDGKKGNYSETDKPNPMSVYAKTKFQGEEIIAKNYDNFLSIRTSLHGWNPNPLKPSLSSLIIDRAKRNENFFATDQISSLMFTNDLANILIELLQSESTGIFNVASADSMTKYRFSLVVAGIFNLKTDLIKVTSLCEFEKRFSLVARRPQNTSLDVSKVEDSLGKKMSTISESVITMKQKEEEFRKKVMFLNAN